MKDINKTDFNEINAMIINRIKIELEKPVPIHLIYRTAITRPGGGLEYRKDIYGRDAKIWAALQAEGVVLVSVNG